ncbi:MAG: VWA domain-containing protein [Candidatus Electrothrix sp. MAN1_4]|nr:VWA domain-containing protein [Candidatus Electrothrix sp. MAN1_4]
MAIRKQLANGQGSVGGVMAMEPHIGAGQERMIMYPVLDFYASDGKNDLLIDGKPARLLQVAGRTRGSDSGNRNASVAIDIIFVMDTTYPMRPYLENLLLATEQFVRQHPDDGLRFGFIGYQDKNPQFSYTTKEFTSRTLSASEFVHALAQVKANDSPVRGDDIPEAVFEGINTALDSQQWRNESIKIVFLVGDAPGRNEELNTTILRNKTRTRNIRVFAFHLRNPSISKNWDKVSRIQYAELSSFSEGIRGTVQEQSYLSSIDGGAEQFRQILSASFLEIQTSLETISSYNQSSELPASTGGSLSELIFHQGTQLYTDNSLPDQEFTGWVCDTVLTNPDRRALTPMILLTENELSELTARVRELKEVGEKALRGEGGTTRDFFDLVSKNTRLTIVDPSAVDFRDPFSIPLDISEFPYKSDIMAADHSDFDNPVKVQKFILKMSYKLMHYEDLLRRRGDTTVWKKLSAGARDRDRVVGVELNQLP